MVTKAKQIVLSGAILAGGSASRLGGIQKGLLKNENGCTIIGRLIGEFQQAGISEIILSANDPAPYKDLGLVTVPDNRRGAGPIAGVAAALRYFTGRCDGVLFVPCDLPCLTAAELDALKEAFLRTDAEIVYARTADFFCHPLCAVVHIGAAARIVSALKSGQTKVRDIWSRLQAEPVIFAQGRAFMNINTFPDIDRWRKDLDEQKSLC